MRREPDFVLGPAGERSRFKEGVHRIGDLEVLIAVFECGVGRRIEWRLRNPRQVALEVDRVGVEIATSSEILLEHGWQSWSVVQRCHRSDVRRSRRASPVWRRSMLVADPSAAGHVVAGDPFLLDESGLTGFLSSSRHFGTVEAEGENIRAWALLDGIQMAAGDEIELDALWFASCDPGEAYSSYAELWGRAAGARTTASSRPGWCSWYRHRERVTPDDVRRAALECKRHGLSVVQIDDGHQASIGEWRSPSRRWASVSRADVAAEISAHGLVAGIWTAPFLTAHDNSKLGHDQRFALRDQKGRPVRAMNHRSLWGGWAYALDTTNPRVLDDLRETFSSLTHEGFSYHKVDFLYAAALHGRRNDPSATRAQALRRGLDAVREAVGEEGFILACGCPFGPAVGVVDAMRVSTDISRNWSERTTVRGFSETQSSLRSAVRASVLRAPLHRRLWINDPDCVLLDREANGLSEHQRRLMVDVVAGTCGLTMLSDDLAEYREAEWKAVGRLLARPASDAPLDIVDPFSKVLTVRSRTTSLDVDWHGKGSSRLTVASTSG